MERNELNLEFPDINAEGKNLTEEKRDVESIHNRVYKKVTGRSPHESYSRSFGLSGMAYDRGILSSIYIDNNDATICCRYTDSVEQHNGTQLLKNAGCKGVSKVPGEHLMCGHLDVSDIIEDYIEDKANADIDYENELNALDIDKYKPTDAIINKLKSRRDAGSKENVKAIYRSGNFDKLFTYYYVAGLIGWTDLKYDIKQVLSWNEQKEYEDLFNAIDARVNEVSSNSDTRTKDQIKLQGMFRNLANTLISKGVDFKFTDRPTRSQELDKDRRNGRCWTISYRLSIPSINKDYDFCHHTSESVDGGDYGWGLEGYTGDYSKKDVEAWLIKHLTNDGVL